MYEIFLKMTENFIDTIESTTLKDEEINIKHVATNFTSDLIFSTAFGLEGEV
jgi:cytochrome P450 family 6